MGKQLHLAKNLIHCNKEAERQLKQTAGRHKRGAQKPNISYISHDLQQTFNGFSRGSVTVLKSTGERHCKC